MRAVAKLPDNVAIMVHSDYKGSIMMKRAKQVNRLVVSKTKPQTTLVTLADYQSEAIKYKFASHADYADFDYCKASLLQAAIAPPNIQGAIKTNLISLENTWNQQQNLFKSVKYIGYSI